MGVEMLPGKAQKEWTCLAGREHSEEGEFLQKTQSLRVRHEGQIRA